MDMHLRKRISRSQKQVPSILLRQAEFLVKLGKTRSALVLYGWALDLAPADLIANRGQAEARLLAIEMDTHYYLKRITGKDLNQCVVST